jgi:non-specific serine/threonine protein kinase
VTPRAFDKYLVQQLLGQGGMAEVFLGLDPDLNREVAIKVVMAGLGRDPEFEARFRQEAKLVAGLRHPHIIQIFAFDLAEARPFMVMEYLAGGTLKDRLAAPGGLSPAERVRQMQPIAAALDHAHAEGIVHRDLKPTNILFTTTGTPVLADFGIARLLDAATRLTRTGGLVGTPLYIAPEQVAGQPVDPQADQYSLGVILYQLVTGRAPFRAATSSALLIQHLTAPPPAPRLLRPDLPSEVDAVLLRALAKDPAARFASAGELVEALLSALGAEASAAAPAAGWSLTPTVGRAVAGGPARPLAGSLSGAALDDAPTEADPDLPFAPGSSAKPAAPGGASTASTAAGQLPPVLTAFVGREAELETLLGLLASGARLVTVYGPGGAGKSRLAVEAARRLAEASGPDEAGTAAEWVVFVPLAGVSAADYVAAALAESAGLALAGSTSPDEQLLDYLRPRRGLLVLDNFEHLLAAAPLLEAILAAAPGIRLLLTSRELMDLHGEHTLELRGLPLEPSRPADPAQTLPGGGESAAARLFALAAQRADPGFAVDRDNRAWVQRICELVAGLPLAIELAAVWVRQMTCAEIAAEIEHSLDFLRSTQRNVPERHRSLRAVFESAWQQLSANEQTALRGLAIFPAGFGREAAEVVAGADLHRLAALAAASLVDGTPQGRYTLHAVVRQYALEKLEAAGERAALQATYARYYAAFAAERAAALKTSAQAEALAALGLEIENLRSAWGRAAAARQVEILELMVEPLFRFYLLRCWYREGEAALGQGMAALEAPGGPAASLTLARMRLRQGGLVQVLGKQAEAQAHLEQSLSALAPLKAPGEMAMAHIYLGNLAYRQGHHLPAREHYRRAAEFFEPLGDAWGLATAYNNLGNVAKRLDELAEARRLYQASLALTRSFGEPIGEAGCLTNLGEVAVLLGEHAKGQRLHTEALGIFRDLGDDMGVGVALHNLGQAAFYSGDFAKAGQHVAESLATRQAREDTWDQAESHYMLGAVAAEQGEWRQAAAEAEAAHRFYAAAGNPQRLAACRYARAEAESALGREAAAAAQLASALAQLDSGTDESDSSAARLSRLALALDEFGDWARAWRLARFLLQQPGVPPGLRVPLAQLHDTRVRRLPAAIRARGMNLGLAQVLQRLLDPPEQPPGASE